MSFSNRWQTIRTVRRATEPLAPNADAIPGPNALAGSLQLRHVDAGSCNGCELEIASAFGPVYDAERFGARLVASPRHADGALVTGPVTQEHGGPLDQDARGHAAASRRHRRGRLRSRLWRRFDGGYGVVGRRGGCRRRSTSRSRVALPIRRPSSTPCAESLVDDEPAPSWLAERWSASARLLCAVPCCHERRRVTAAAVLVWVAVRVRGRRRPIHVLATGHADRAALSRTASAHWRRPGPQRRWVRSSCCWLPWWRSPPRCTASGMRTMASTARMAACSTSDLRHHLCSLCPPPAASQRSWCCGSSWP